MKYRLLMTLLVVVIAVVLYVAFNATKTDPPRNPDAGMPSHSQSNYKF
jgi:hypothetical protein